MNYVLETGLDEKEASDVWKQLHTSRLVEGRSGLEQDEGVGVRARTIQHGIYKGFIAPVALYGVLGAVIWRNRRAAKKGGSDE